jgi:endonuclease G, mitochondrial
MVSFLKIYSFSIFLLILGCAQVGHKSSDAVANELIVKRPHYELSYNEEHEQANWVFYSLESKQLRNCVKRVDNFRSDPLVVTGSAEVEDYKNSGFDRGHLLPAGDMKFDNQAMKDTFYLSNISPQPPSFNRGQWANLENLVRAWALKYQKIWIATGPVLHKGLSTIGRVNQVSVPEEFYKVILRKEGNRFRGIGFLMKTSMPEATLTAYAINIDSVEKHSGIDFYPFLKGKDEQDAEGKVEIAAWDFNAVFEYLPCAI